NSRGAKIILRAFERPINMRGRQTRKRRRHGLFVLPRLFPRFYISAPRRRSTPKRTAGLDIDVYQKISSPHWQPLHQLKRQGLIVRFFFVGM
ncbi:MAG: hypothetical protein FWF96_08240, partial [Kiritimatiellaeota bacterium]|nr:hypothetical protein [Kiritimatiellota bacterium]